MKHESVFTLFKRYCVDTSLDLPAIVRLLNRDGAKFTSDTRDVAGGALSVWRLPKTDGDVTVALEVAPTVMGMRDLSMSDCFVQSLTKYPDDSVAAAIKWVGVPPDMPGSQNFTFVIMNGARHAMRAGAHPNDRWLLTAVALDVGPALSLSHLIGRGWSDCGDKRVHKFCGRAN